jgi:hypothetical protein
MSHMAASANNIEYIALDQILTGLSSACFDPYHGTNKAVGI